MHGSVDFRTGGASSDDEQNGEQNLDGFHLNFLIFLGGNKPTENICRGSVTQRGDCCYNKSVIHGIFISIVTTFLVPMVMRFRRAIHLSPFFRIQRVPIQDNFDSA